MSVSQATAELNKRKIENPSRLFWLLVPLGGGQPRRSSPNNLETTMYLSAFSTSFPPNLGFPTIFLAILRHCLVQHVESYKQWMMHLIKAPYTQYSNHLIKEAHCKQSNIIIIKFSFIRTRTIPSVTNAGGFTKAMLSKPNVRYITV